MSEIEQEEKEANLFAIELLMPEDFVRAEIRKLGGIDVADSKKVAALAKKFKVNESMMAFRLGMLYAP